MSLEKLYLTFVLLGGFARAEGAEVLALPCVRVDLSRVDTVLPVLQLADHASGKCNSCAPDRMTERHRPRKLRSVDGTGPLESGKGRIDPASVTQGVTPEGPVPAKRESDSSVPLAPGLAHEKSTPVTGGEHLASVLSAKLRAQYDRVLKGEAPIDAAAFSALTGITVDSEEVARLDAVIQRVARRMGLDHPVKFMSETKYLGFSFPYAFLATFEGWNRKENQPIVIGLGLKARSLADLDLLYRYDTKGRGIPPALEPMSRDFLALDEEQRIEALLVHEFHELEAARAGSPSPHHSAVAEAPDTDLEISPRVRQHLELYARANQAFLDEEGR